MTLFAIRGAKRLAAERAAQKMPISSEAVVASSVSATLEIKSGSLFNLEVKRSERESTV